MDAHPPPSAGTGAVNLRGEVAIYLSRQPEAPTALVVHGRLVRVLAGERVLGEAEYTDRVLEAIGKRASAVVGELESDGREIRSAVVPVLKERP
jgi:hypothetical protein